MPDAASDNEDAVDGATVTETVTKIHPYYIGKARKALLDAGGDPDLCEPLAAWAEEAKSRDKQPQGVIIAQDGRVLAETFRSRAPAAATYVDNAGREKYNLIGNVVDLAVGTIERIEGMPVAHVKLSQFSGPREKELGQVLWCLMNGETPHQCDIVDPYHEGITVSDSVTRWAHATAAEHGRAFDVSDSDIWLGVTTGVHAPWPQHFPVLAVREGTVSREDMEIIRQAIVSES